MDMAFGHISFKVTRLRVCHIMPGPRANCSRNILAKQPADSTGLHLLHAAGQSHDFKGTDTCHLNFGIIAEKKPI